MFIRLSSLILMLVFCMINVNSVIALKVGDIAPNIRLYNQDNQVVDTFDFLGKKNIVIFFYPKDSSLMCTLEAIRFSNLKKEFDAIDTVVIGISQDDQKAHQEFIKKSNLDLILLSDREFKATKAYDSYKPGIITDIQRNTFFINQRGIIAYAWYSVVNVLQHSNDVYNYIKEEYSRNNGR